MGVPKFFRYISERYPCLSEVVKEYQIPDFDNLYLDMNGIIHTCSHPDDGDPHFRITEERIFQDIFHYIEVLFRMIKPRKLFFMAVDGVAPRAKMNQQRGRRFRSAREAQVLETKALERGETLPKQARFDSNCITPGTTFMVRLHEQLKYFVVHKISTDKLWQNCKIILSGHETPGEGEHKIMDYIRYMKVQPGYDPNTRHCLYGLDADLIMLGLCTHEPHFSLLREEVKFGRKSNNKRKNIPEQIRFFLLHLSLMREYLELEFYQLKDVLMFKYDIEKIIDDWVLMGFLVGNDFIPNLPNMHIANGALPVLYDTYMKVLPKLGGYINESGTLNLERFEAFIQELSNIDIENFSDHYADLKWFEGKTGKGRRPLLEEDGDAEIAYRKPDSDLDALIKTTEDMLLEPLTGELEIDTDNSEEDLFNAEFIQHKTDYYRNKLDYENVTPDVLRSQAEEYVRAIQWNLNYYYNGVCSWSWYYPHHYAPYVSDIKGFSNFKPVFDLGTPFKPYEQLLAVLPSASKTLLPDVYQHLMTSEDSMIKDYYPENFKTDLNGKKQDWEAVVLIPFIDENVLLKAMDPCNKALTPDEIKNNTPGPMLAYTYTPQNLGCYEAPEYFPVITVSHAKCQSIEFEEICVPKEKLIKGVYPGAKFDVYYPGFPTMKHLNYIGSLEKARVKVFEQPSRYENMILRIIDDEDVESSEELDAIAKRLLGTTIHVGWPHLVEALVVSISNREFRYHSIGEKGQYNVEENKGHLTQLWNSELQGINDYYQNRLGVDVGLTNVLVYVKVLVGRQYMFTSKGRVTLEKQWASVTSIYPLQTIVQNIAVYEENYTPYKDVQQVFPKGSVCFMLGQPGYGSAVEIIDFAESSKDTRLKLNLKMCIEPDLTSVMQLERNIKVNYMNVYIASSKIGISKGLFSRITGSIFVIPGGRSVLPQDDVVKINIGLNLKFNKKNEEVPGYSRRDNGSWYYSEKTIAIVLEYKKKFPQVFNYLKLNSGNDMFYEEDLSFNVDDVKGVLKDISTWIKQQPYYSNERRACGSSVLDPDTVKALEEMMIKYNTKNYKPKQMVLSVKPHLLYKPDLQIGYLMPDSSATFQLFDRIVNVREGYTVPLGYKGTIVGILESGSEVEDETLYDVLFDQEFVGGLAVNCLTNRGYRLPKPAMINLSYGERVYKQKKERLNTHNLQEYSNQKNSYPNSGNVSSPNSHLTTQRPPRNWGFGCGYSSGQPPLVPPVQPAKQHNPSIYPSHIYQPPHLMAQNNSGPNAFVPYNSTNNPPLSKSYSNYGPNSSQSFYPNTNAQDHFNRLGGYKSNQRFNNNYQSMGKTEKAEGKSTYDRNVKRETNQPVSTKTEKQYYKVDSDMLKKVLRINEDFNNSPNQDKAAESEKNNGSLHISVEDIFAHARIKEKQQQQPQQEANLQDAYYTVKLSKEFQARKFGCPRYCYKEMDNKFMAKIILPIGVTITGDYEKSKDEAAENVAKKTLNYLETNNADLLSLKPSLDAVPEPPKRWQHYPESSQASRFPTKNWVNSTSKNGSPNHKKWERLEKPEAPENGKLSINNSFVPLQAFKPKHKHISSNRNAQSTDNTKTVASNIASEREQAEQESLSSTSSKPRRERKSRIAANFETAMTV